MAEKIVSSFQPQSKVILEVGPGQGILTNILLKCFPEHDIIAVEIDKNLTMELKKQFAATSLQTVNADILQTKLPNLTHGCPVSIIANLPYYISKKFFDWMISQSDLVSDGVILVQKEFAEKLLLQNPNAQGIIINSLFQINKLLNISSNNFRPRPKVDSILLKLNKKVIIDPKHIKKFYSFLKLSFSQRRKILFSNLKNLLKDNSLFSNPLLRKRAEELNPQEFYMLFLKVQANSKKSDQS